METKKLSDITSEELAHSLLACSTVLADILHGIDDQKFKEAAVEAEVIFDKIKDLIGTNNGVQIVLAAAFVTTKAANCVQLGYIPSLESELEKDFSEMEFYT